MNPPSQAVANQCQTRGTGRTIGRKFAEPSNLLDTRRGEARSAVVKIKSITHPIGSTQQYYTYQLLVSDALDLLVNTVHPNRHQGLKETNQSHHEVDVVSIASTS
jgi:hypothetical protein